MVFCTFPAVPFKFLSAIRLLLFALRAGMYDASGDVNHPPLGQVWLELFSHAAVMQGFGHHYLGLDLRTEHTPNTSS